MSKENSGNKRKGYMLYVLEYLQKNPKILKDKGFLSLDSFKEREKHFKHFTKVSEKNFKKAFNLKTSPETDTLSEIHTAFKIPISFEKFEVELEKGNIEYTKFLESYSPDETKQNPKTDSPSSENLKNYLPEKDFKQKRWKRITLFSSLLLFALFTIYFFYRHNTNVTKPSPLSETENPVIRTLCKTLLIS